GANLNEIDMKSRSVLVNSIRDLSYEDVSVVVSPWSEVGAPAAPPATAASAPAATVTPAPAAAPFSMVQSALSAFKAPNL
ncbi:EscJ/YscJ/HrcJ family type III secretion inner membrane ring protein, partial [Pseudomonas sp. BGM005]|nr:EscJ/YscJ/HrcJ family type III secretion inner membrane ring protein [Pseudomonas sp. BG5]